MKQYKITKTFTKALIAFCLVAIGLAAYSTKFYLKADNYIPDEVKPSSFSGIGQIVSKGLNTLFYLIGSIAFISLLISGIQFISAGGNPTNAGKAKKSILYSVIGIVLAILSLVIIRVTIQVTTASPR